MSEILVRPPELRRISEQLRSNAKKIDVALREIDNDILALKGDNFLGNRANILQSHYSPKREALLQAKNIVVHFADDLQNAASVFEQADKSAIQSTGISSNFSFPQWAEGAMAWIKNGGELLQDVALVAALKNGQTFADQVKILGPNWYSKYVLGLPENLRNIKASTLIDDMAADSLKVTPWSTTFTLVKLATDVVPDWFKYTDIEHRGAAVATDALIAAASLQASYYGIQAGALVGSAICPGVGTVVGGVVGGFLAGWTTDHVLTTPLTSLLPEAGVVAGGVIGNGLLPGFGAGAGGYLGGTSGRFIMGLISPDVAQLSIKDFVIEETAEFINNTGANIGNQISPLLSQ